MIAFEGSSLTLLGMLKYDPAADNGKGAFQMTEVAGFLAGGAKECKKLIVKQITTYQGFLTLCGLLTGLFGLVSYFIIYNKTKKMLVKRRLE